MTETTPLYKLMILYMLKRINYSMSGAQIAEFMLERSYTSYFSMQQSIAELEEAGYVHAEHVSHATYYAITPEGEQTIGFFQSRLAPEIREEIDLFLKENRLRILNDSSVLADYYRNTNGEFDANLRVREKKQDLINLTLTVPDEAQAQAICRQWRAKSESIYEYLMRELMREKSHTESPSAK